MTAAVWRCIYFVPCLLLCIEHRQQYNAAAARSAAACACCAAVASGGVAATSATAAPLSAAGALVDTPPAAPGLVAPSYASCGDANSLDTGDETAGWVAA